MAAALIAIAAVVIIVVLILFAAVKVAREYERGVIFRLGRGRADRADHRA